MNNTSSRTNYCWLNCRIFLFNNNHQLRCADHYVENIYGTNMYLLHPNFIDIGMHARHLKDSLTENWGTNYYVVLQCTGCYALAVNYTRASSGCIASGDNNCGSGSAERTALRNFRRDNPYRFCKSNGVALMVRPPRKTSEHLIGSFENSLIHWFFSLVSYILSSS